MQYAKYGEGNATSLYDGRVNGINSYMSSVT